MIGRLVLLIISLAAAMATAQTTPQQPDRPAQPPSSADQNSSSSRSTKTDLSPPLGDADEHPNSNVGDLAGPAEVHPWNPHRADKDVEVGDYHLKRKNYRGAEDRYREALYYQNNNAAAMYGLAETLEKENKRDEAVAYYTKYLKTVPNGPKAADAKKALQRLGAPIPEVSQNTPPPPEPVQLYEKKSLKQRAKDAAPTSVCLGGLCTPTKTTGQPDPPPDPK